jgi:hypothetical protein
LLPWIFAVRGWVFEKMWGLYRSPLLMWGPPLEKGVFIFYWLIVAYSHRWASLPQTVTVTSFPLLTK